MLVKRREGSLANGQMTKHFICVRPEKSLPKQQELERSTACKQESENQVYFRKIPLRQCEDEMLEAGPGTVA